MTETDTPEPLRRFTLVCDTFNGRRAELRYSGPDAGEWVKADDVLALQRENARLRAERDRMREALEAAREVVAASVRAWSFDGENEDVAPDDAPDTIALRKIDAALTATADGGEVST